MTVSTAISLPLRCTTAKSKPYQSCNLPCATSICFIGRESFLCTYLRPHHAFLAEAHACFWNSYAAVALRGIDDEVTPDDPEPIMVDEDDADDLLAAVLESEIGLGDSDWNDDTRRRSALFSLFVPRSASGHILITPMDLLGHVSHKHRSLVVSYKHLSSN